MEKLINSFVSGETAAFLLLGLGVKVRWGRDDVTLPNETANSMIGVSGESSAIVAPVQGIASGPYLIADCRT
jgi:hypothetical protein